MTTRFGPQNAIIKQTIHRKNKVKFDNHAWFYAQVHMFVGMADFQYVKTLMEWQFFAESTVSRNRANKSEIELIA